MTDFGDFEPADAFDTAPADPEQVAIRLQRLRVEAGLDTDRWDDLDLHAQTVRITIVAALLAWLRRQGST